MPIVLKSVCRGDNGDRFISASVFLKRWPRRQNCFSGMRFLRLSRTNCGCHRVPRRMKDVSRDVEVQQDLELGVCRICEFIRVDPSDMLFWSCFRRGFVSRSFGRHRATCTRALSQARQKEGCPTSGCFSTWLVDLRVFIKSRLSCVAELIVCFCKEAACQLKRSLDSVLESVL